MNIVHTGLGFPRSSGVTSFCFEIAKSQLEKGHNVEIIYKIDISDSNVVLGHALKTSSPVFAQQYDIVHLHAFWSLFQLDVLRYCCKHSVPFIVSPHGGLMPRVFMKGWLKKHVFWRFFLRPLIKRASAIHCTSETEVEACQSLGLKGPFIVAPLGVHLPDLDEPLHIKTDNIHTVLFLGRLGEEKGLLNLLTAWKQLQCSSVSKKWVLKLAGPDWRGYKKILDDKIAIEQIPNVFFTGDADDTMKDQLYRSADIFVLPSPMENFSMVVLEALAYGVPTIATKGTPWQELESEHCGLWIEQGVETLAKALQSLMLLTDDERSALGSNGRALAASKYQWPVIAEKLLDAYKMAIKNK